MSADQTPTRRKPLSVPLLVAGLAALAVAVWGALGGPNLVSAGTLVAVLAIIAVAVAGVVLIMPRGDRPRDEQR